MSMGLKNGVKDESTRRIFSASSSMQRKKKSGYLDACHGCFSA